MRPLAPAKTRRKPAPKGRAAPQSGAEVFDRLLAAILGGTYAAGTHLPPERDLATELGASRATVREALRRLASLRLVDARQGSGVLVRSVRDWSFAVLPHYLKLGAPLSGGGALADLVLELLDLRREVVLGLLRLIAPRLAARAGSTQHIAERAQAAWARRGDALSFVRADLEILRALLEESGMLASVWLLNALGDVYVELARSMGDRARVPATYLESHLAIDAALSRGDGEAACAEMARFLAESDRQILDVLGLQPLR